jgi:hypothetical protein
MWVEAADLQAFLEAPTQSWKLPILETGRSDMAYSNDSARCSCSSGALMATKKQQGVAMDVCPECSSIWLDGGELAVLLERYQETPERRRSPFFQFVLDFLPFPGLF